MELEQYRQRKLGQREQRTSLRCREEVKAARGGKLELLLLSVFTLPQSGASLKSSAMRMRWRNVERDARC